jgi:3-hydroxyacyl-CoA dehydrogenase/enoyl-CoA hydratase/3-hydroxybutyryl-CoA epimerase
MPALNEAGLLIREGVSIDRIDHAMRRFGMSHGPCEWMDRFGIDLIARTARALQPSFADRLHFESGFGLMVDNGWLGNQCERGFYQSGLRKRKPNREAVQLWRTQSRGETARSTPALSDVDFQHWIQNRLGTLMVLEAIRCLEEGIVKDADDLDCAMCLTGWATHRGGPIGYALDLGAQALLSRCTLLAAEHGERYALTGDLQSVIEGYCER